MRITSIIILTFILSSCVNIKHNVSPIYPSSKYYDSILSGDSFKYWDFSPRGGWLFIKGFKLIEYQYNYKGNRIKEMYGDIIMDTLSWSIKNDSFIYWNNALCKRIISFSEDSVIFETLKPLNNSGKKSILTPSNDQLSGFKSETFLNPDTSKWKIKIKILDE